VSSTVFRSELGDLAVSTGLLRLPPRGNWLAHLELGNAAAPAEGTPASLLLYREDGEADTLTGTIRRSGILPGSETVTITLVGGAGKLLDEVSPLDQVAGITPLPAGLVARAIADAAGELLADGVEDALDGYQLPRWTRFASSAREALDLLVELLGLVWRVQRDGAIWVGVETWEAVDGAAVHVGGDPSDGMVLYAPNGAPLAPGTTIDGMQAIAVDYRIEPGRVRVEVRSALAGDPGRLADRTAYRATYPAIVRLQNANGTIDVTADDPKLGDLRAVPFRVGIPGALVTIPADSRVRIAFDGADPRGAYATAIEQDGEATAAIALVGDAVELGYLTGTVGGVPVVFAISPVMVPGAEHLAGVVTGPGSIRVKLR
jgi:hypothetical protein